MRNLFILMICVSVILISTTYANDLDLDKSILNKINSLGVDINNAVFDEIEPSEITSYEDFSKEDISLQKDNSTYWSTIWHNDELYKLEIIVKSSSFLKGYPVTNLFDKKIDTTWVEGVNGNGIGEWISITLSPKTKTTNYPCALNYFGMIPGYLKNDKAWEGNNRVKAALLIIKRFGYGENGPYYDYAILRLKFEDFKGLQVFDISEYERSTTSNKQLWIIIEDVYKGTKYDDTCISELVIGGSLDISAYEGGI